jgi:hypothetical protein
MFDSVFGAIKGHTDLLTKMFQEIRDSRFEGVYLFSGIAGIGKYTVARTIGKYLTCTGLVDDTCRCENCRLFPNVPDYLEINKGTDLITISDIEPIDDFLSIMSYRGKSKVIVIDNAHNLNNASSNRLLKLLEEIPPKCSIILVSENPEKIISTITSRCYQIDFEGLSVEDYNSILNNLGYKKSSIMKISRMIPYFSYSILQNFNRYAYYSDYMPKFIKELKNKREEDLIAEIKSIDYEEDLDIFIDLFLIIINDILKIRYKCPDSIFFINNIDLLEEFACVWKEDLCIYMIDRVRKIRNNIKKQINLKHGQLFLPAIMWLYYFLHKKTV